MSSNGQKDTIYIDIDDEITAVIDKLRSSPHKIVALVLPKRAAVFQSVVNMKLLKRAADDTKKNVVLITSEAALMPLAATIGLHVAKTLQSKPEIPSAALLDTPADIPEDADLDKQAPIGALAGLPPEDERIDVDNTPGETPAAGKGGPGGKAGKAGKGAKPKKDKKLKVPNFESFRKRLLLGGVALVLLIVGWILAFMVLPKATVTLTTDTSNLDTDLTFTADPAAQQLDQENAILPAISKEFRKTDTEKAAATGQKDLGNKASGSVSLKNCTPTDGGVTIPAGTTLSTSNLAYVTQEATSLPASSFSGGGTCTTTPQSVNVTAANPGEQYNIGGGKTFTVAGFSGVSGVDSSAMSGGTSRMVKIVSQQDIDNAKQKITDRGGTEAPKDLEEKLKDEGYFPLTDTLTPGNPTVTSAPNAGQEANEVTVTSTTIYTMLGVKEDDLKKFVEEDAKKRIDTGKQAIRDNGLDDATIRVQQKKPNGQISMSLKTIVVAGPQLDDDAIKKEIAGKKRGQAQDIVRSRPGIKDVEIAYSPFWVQSTPKKASKITIVFKQNESNADDNNQ